jgi:hypothetical protein
MAAKAKPKADAKKSDEKPLPPWMKKDKDGKPVRK